MCDRKANIAGKIKFPLAPFKEEKQQSDSAKNKEKIYWYKSRGW